MALEQLENAVLVEVVHGVRDYATFER